MSPGQIPKQEARAAKEAEARLLEAARNVFRTAYPNPERTTRISSDALKAAAARAHKQLLPAGLLDELTWSSETFAEYERYLSEARFGRKMRRLAACAVLAIGVGTALWWSLGSSGTSSEAPPVIVREAPPSSDAPTPREPEQTQEPQVTFELAVLDLRGQSPVRGETGPNASRADLPALQARQVNLRTYLPIGSEEGPYELSLAQEADAPIVTARGDAELVNQNIVLTATMDLSTLDPGVYVLGVRRGEFRWAYYQVRVE